MKKEVKEWWQKNKKKVYIGASIAAGLGAAYFLHKKQLPVAKIKHEIAKDIFRPMCEAEKAANAVYEAIDEEIFTNIAPTLEDMILEEGVDEDIITKVFTIPYAKGGNFENGTYEVKKHVQILVRDMCE